MKEPLVSIIIANWNGGSVFEDCIKSLSKIDYRNWELVVVDNGSTDDSIEKLESFRGIKVKTIKNKENVGFAKANNQGVAVSKGKYVLLLNNDTKVEVSFLSKMVQRMMEDDTIGAIQPKILIMDKPELMDNAGSFMTRIGFLDHWGFLQKDSKEFENERDIFSAKGACILIRKDVVDKVGLFDDDFVSYFEESDFCWKVWLVGKRVVFFPNAKIYHKVGYTIRRLNVLNINFHYYKNRICSLLKSFGLLNLIVVLPIHIIISLGIAFAFLLKGSIKNATMIFRALWWNLVHLPSTLRKRSKIQKLRVVSDGVMFKELMVPVDWGKFYKDFKRVEKDIGN